MTEFQQRLEANIRESLRFTASAGHRILVRLDGDRDAGIYHPTWELRYLDAASSALSEVA